MNSTDYVYEMLSKKKKGMKFNDIYNTLVKKKILLNNDPASLFSDLMFDIRFCTTKNNAFDLSSRHTYDEIHSHTGVVDLDDDEEIEYNEDEEENYDVENEDDDIEEDDTIHINSRNGFEIKSEDDDKIDLEEEDA